MNWVRVTTVENIPLREGRAVRVGDDEIAIFNLGDRFVACENSCPHRGGPLADGIVSGSSVVCPLHAYKTARKRRPREDRTTRLACRGRGVWPEALLLAE